MGSTPIAKTLISRGSRLGARGSQCVFPRAKRERMWGGLSCRMNMIGYDWILLNMIAYVWIWMNLSSRQTPPASLQIMWDVCKIRPLVLIHMTSENRKLRLSEHVTVTSVDINLYRQRGFRYRKRYLEWRSMDNTRKWMGNAITWTFMKDHDMPCMTYFIWPPPTSERRKFKQSINYM